MKISCIEIAVALSMASTVPGAATPIKTPDRWARYDLEKPIDYTNSTADTTLTKRKNVGVCESNRGSSSACSYLGHIYDIVNNIGGCIKEASNQKSCQTYTGTINDIAYKYYATGAPGHDCDTTAEQKTIAGAIEHHLKNKNNNQLCDTECLNLEHGGTWHGYLLLGPRASFASDAYCGPALSFDNCDNGGKGDFQ